VFQIVLPFNILFYFYRLWAFLYVINSDIDFHGPLTHFVDYK